MQTAKLTKQPEVAQRQTLFGVRGAYRLGRGTAVTVMAIAGRWEPR
jgi:hypothetical protein